MIEQKLTNEKNVPGIAVIINFLKVSVENDEQLKNGILNEEKSIEKCWEYIQERAKQLANNGMAMIEDATVYGWSTHYFTEDDDTLCKDLGKPTKAEREETARLAKEKSEKQKLEKPKKKQVEDDDFDEEESEEDEVVETEEEKNQKLEAKKKAQEEKELKEKGFIPISIFDL